jgi:hypothetical protein
MHISAYTLYRVMSWEWYVIAYGCGHQVTLGSRVNERSFSLVIRSSEGSKVEYIYVVGWLRCGTEGAGSGLTREEMSSLHSSATLAPCLMLVPRKLCVGRNISVGHFHI